MEMERQATGDFVVDTVGYCFICKEEISPQLPSTLAQPGSSSSIYSMLYLSRYLNIKMRKVFNEEVSIPESLLEKVEMSTLKVSLCEECASWNSRLSELLRNLEKIEIETASYLRLIHGKLKRADQDEQTDILSKLTDRCSDSELMGKLEVAEVLRKETMERCSQKMNGPQLKVRIQKLTEKDIKILKQPKFNVVTSNATEYESGLNDVKLETSSTEGMWEESETGYLNDFEERTIDSTQGNILPIGIVETDSGPGSPEIRSSSSKRQKNCIQKCQTGEYNSGIGPPKIRMSVKQNYIRDSKTGEHECKLCGKVFASNGGFHMHYQNIHLKLRHKCKTCNKEFTLQCNLRAHQDSVHLNRRLKCEFCNALFRSASGRYRHIRLKKCQLMKNTSTSEQQEDHPQSSQKEHFDI